MSKTKSKKTDKQTVDDKGFFEEFIKPVTIRAFKNMKWRNLKNTFSNKVERNLYITSFFVNPLALYFLTHNKYFFLRLDLKLYGLVALIGYFFQKGTLQFIQENNGISIGKKKSCLSKNKHEKQLGNVLNSLKIPFRVAKTNVTEFSTQIYILSDVPIKNILNNERDMAKRMHLENKNLTITVDKSYFVFDIRNSEQKVYYFDEYIKKVIDKQLKGKELPFILGIQQSTGKMIVSDLLVDDSILIAGARGNGKSCFVNVLIQSLMTFNVSRISFIMIDFKGNEASQYKDFSNCIFFGSKSHKKVNIMLEELITEMNNRYKKLGKIKNLRDYNEAHTEKLPYIVLIIDELSLVTIGGGKLADEINEKLIELLNVGRAAGIIVIGAMQRPNAEQIDTNVRANLDAKFVFRVADKKETQYTDTPGAEKLAKGEFIANTRTFDCERFKGLYIEDKKRDFVFEELEKRYVNGGQKNGFIINLNK